MAKNPDKGQRRQMNAVEKNACWVEAIKNESKGRLLNENFDFNPKNLVLLSEKPTQNRATFGSNPSETEKELTALKTKLDTLTSVPKKKYPFPMTSNQEIGWDNDDTFDQFRPKYPYNKRACEETKYASDYVTMTKRSPYANKRQE
eukprot:403337519